MKTLILPVQDTATASPSFASSALEDLVGCNEDEAARRKKIIMDVAATSFAG